VAAALGAGELGGAVDAQENSRKRPVATPVILAQFQAQLSQPQGFHSYREIQQYSVHDHQLALGYLTETDIEAYLTQRFAVGAHGRAPLPDLARLIHQRTDGTPLFMVALVDYFVTQGVLVQEDGQWVLTRSACNILSAISNWFTEGFDTKDLQEAKALLEELQ
jgi:hypothetical protein